MVALLDALIKVEGVDAYTVYQRELNNALPNTIPLLISVPARKNRKTIQVHNSKQ